MEAPVVNMDECHLEEPIPSEEHLEIYEEDSLSEDEIQDLIVKDELQEEVDVIQSIFPTLVVKPLVYQDPMWPTPPPTMASFLHAQKAHSLKLNLVDHKCYTLPNLAKLEGIDNQDPYGLNVRTLSEVFRGEWFIERHLKND
ncbi:hypothetical protein TIFTF001_055429 [Ficus carica]|uniref:Uncharacterized protein n=1 Tax=Ficus carica TaxID=3494 RepID=A0AA88EJ90_FICCA|nr:hypothetical protein TIFTF001_055426 [Ficus carica]GMN74538.1 hypothetical protein TIFTF001_055427 [Ficus carica]GMN74542.1 hypothetical protein TIFTF001_055428 [Ficus carica]GMN74545.1 hypothetical protein TIFTF001_055429 [Ficus carica]